MPSSGNWSELPSDLMVNILQRIPVIDIFKNVEQVCTYWREICKDPALWRVINMNNFLEEGRYITQLWLRILKLAVDRSQGQLVDLTVIDYFGTKFLLHIADSLSQLRRLEVEYYGSVIDREVFKKLPLLEELSFDKGGVRLESFELVGCNCPLLKTLRVNYVNDVPAFAIVKNLPRLAHLELIGSRITNVMLQAILDGCCHLESLDLRRCYDLDVNEDLRQRCSQQIKRLKLPNDSLDV